MAQHVCPWWLGYGLLLPFRRLLEHPTRMLAPWVREGMLVVEPGCGMGYFTLDLARLVGPAGRVVAVDVQERMLAALRRRAARAGLAERIDARPRGQREPRPRRPRRHGRPRARHPHDPRGARTRPPSSASCWAALRPGAPLLVIEPKGHVSAVELGASIELAVAAGLEVIQRPIASAPRSALLRRPRA
ncbi:MAG: methyltransferase domain-containing protein [Thermoanaerobaculaceae bacterium]